MVYRSVKLSRSRFPSNSKGARQPPPPPIERVSLRQWFSAWFMSLLITANLTHARSMVGKGIFTQRVNLGFISACVVARNGTSGACPRASFSGVATHLPGTASCVSLVNGNEFGERVKRQSGAALAFCPMDGQTIRDGILT